MQHVPQLEQRQFGKNIIAVQDDDFFSGYQVGHLIYMAEWQGIQVTDVRIYNFVCQMSQSVVGSDRYRAGTISGWYAALFGYRLLPQPVGSEQAPAEKKG